MVETTGNSVPMLLIVLGALLIVLMLVLLLWMRREKNRPKEEEKPPKTAHPKQKEKRPAASKPAPTREKEEKRTNVPEKVAPVPEKLPVLSEPVKKMPGIQRRNFQEFEGKRILVAEDNEINRKLILTLLDGLGLKLETAENGREALEKLENAKGKIDLLLMDINMPEMNGLEATREIREHPRYDRMPVVALTASTNEEEVRDILECGMNAYLEKPIDLGKLYRIFKLFFDWQNAQPDHGNKKAPLTQPHAGIDRKIFDWEKGLRYSNGDEELYAGILDEFIDQYGHSDRRLKEWIAEKNYDSVKAMAIDLEGISATIGAGPFYESVKQMRRIIEQKAYTMLSDFLQVYREELRTLRREIEKYLDDEKIESN